MSVLLLVHCLEKYLNIRKKQNLSRLEQSKRYALRKSNTCMYHVYKCQTCTLYIIHIFSSAPTGSFICEYSDSFWDSVSWETIWAGCAGKIWPRDQEILQIYRGKLNLRRTLGSKIQMNNFQNLLCRDWLGSNCSFVLYTYMFIACNLPNKRWTKLLQKCVLFDLALYEQATAASRHKFIETNLITRKQNKWSYICFLLAVL